MSAKRRKIKRFIALTIAAVCLLFLLYQFEMAGILESESSVAPAAPQTSACSSTISPERLNDDYCDCADGSDEPKTSACPNQVFTCRDYHKILRTFPTSRINDGICDCCDGSDETIIPSVISLPRKIQGKIGIYLSPCPKTCLPS